MNPEFAHVEALFDAVAQLPQWPAPPIATTEERAQETQLLLDMIRIYNDAERKFGRSAVFAIHLSPSSYTTYRNMMQRGGGCMHEPREPYRVMFRRATVEPSAYPGEITIVLVDRG
jgi:hypothetical protein